ncbi:glycine-rich domain-containing protein [Lacrimispora sp.]|uniref:glycine-rich domain-containing protein n=1 Tax=Lacrimispora sp. TaxID=2719234 RepID=UPI0028AC8F55|nr:hypothetical protein [Lacrimispora sp.]
MAKHGVTNVAGGGGIGSDEVSVTKEYVLDGKTYVGADTDDEIGTGKMANNGTTTNQSLNASGSFYIKKGYHAQDFTVIANSLASQTSGTAIPSHVLNGETYWTNGIKSTGSMNVQSILSFSSAPYSFSQIVFTWQNPASGPFSGVIIVGKTGGYPANINDGTRYYKGFGNNTYPYGVSNAVVGGFGSGINYYFRAFSYATINGQEWLGSSSYTKNVYINLVTQVFTTSTTWTVPNGVNQVEVFCVGGGGGGGDGSYDTTGSATGSGGGGGYTITQTTNVSPGQQIPIIIGSGGVGYLGGSYSLQRNGSPTYFGSIVAKGGYGGLGDILKHSTPTGKETPTQLESAYYTYGNGGSGGGGGGGFEPDTRDHLYGTPWGAQGGSNGSNGGQSALYNIIISGREDGENVYGYGDQVREWKQEGGRGQGFSTQAFGNGTVYSGGGGGAGGGNWSFSKNGSHQNYGGGGGWGGNYGGGGGGGGSTPAIDGVPNSGGGGGGGAGRQNSSAKRYSGAGGSGICIIRFIG